MKVLITGSSNGIGKACVLKFLKCHHEVIGFDILESDIKDKNYNHHIVDVAMSVNYPDIAMIDGIQILINNAGVQNKNDIEVNLLGCIKITEKYGIQPEIKSIVNVASSSARTGAEFPLYAASKGGVVTYTKYVAQQIAKFGATCNSISPGGVITNLNKHIIFDKVKWNQVLNESMLHKWAHVEEIAEWIYFISVINKSMTAQDILIDNGEFNKCNFIW